MCSFFSVSVFVRESEQEQSETESVLLHFEPKGSMWHTNEYITANNKVIGNEDTYLFQMVCLSAFCYTSRSFAVFPSEKKKQKNSQLFPSDSLLLLLLLLCVFKKCTA